MPFVLVGIVIGDMMGDVENIEFLTNSQLREHSRKVAEKEASERALKEGAETVEYRSSSEIRRQKESKMPFPSWIAAKTGQAIHSASDAAQKFKEVSAQKTPNPKEDSKKKASPKTTAKPFTMRGTSSRMFNTSVPDFDPFASRNSKQSQRHPAQMSGDPFSSPAQKGKHQKVRNPFSDPFEM